MDISKKSVLFRCFTSLFAGILMSFLVVSALALGDAVSVVGSKKSFTVGGKNYEIYATFNKSEFTSGTNLGAAARLDNLSGISPARNIGIQAIICKENSSGVYSVFKSSDYFYNDVEAPAITQVVSDWTVLTGCYKGLGNSAVYYNGKYTIRPTYYTPMIEVTK